MRNRGPEKTITEPDILHWARKSGFDLTVVDTSAVFSRAANRYLRAQASESLLDLVGNYHNLSVWIELKAPGKRSSLSDNQRAFIIRKIKQDCFACVTDSSLHLADLWENYKKAEDKASCLMNDLPKKRGDKSELF